LADWQSVCFNSCTTAPQTTNPQQQLLQDHYLSGISKLHFNKNQILEKLRKESSIFDKSVKNLQKKISQMADKYLLVSPRV